MSTSSNVIFPVSLLYIQLDLNVGEKKDGRNIQLFKRSMIKMPKMNTQPIITSEYPFFTKNVRYPSSIEGADWKAKYEFFFNRPLFIERLRKEIDANPSIYREKLIPKKNATEEEEKELYEWMSATEIHNIMVTLRSLFPIPDMFGKALKNSYQHVIMGEPNNRIIYDLSIRNAVNIFGFMYKFGIISKEREEYFINVNGKRYIVDDVVWRNDIINHPVYSKFLSSQRETYEEVAKSAGDVEEKYDIYLKRLRDEISSLLNTEKIQKDFYKIVCKTPGRTPDCESTTYDMDAYNYYKTLLKKMSLDEFNGLENVVKSGKKFTNGIKFLVHHYYFKDIINKLSKETIQELEEMLQDIGHTESNQIKQSLKAFYDAYQKISKEHTIGSVLENKKINEFNGEWVLESGSLYDYFHFSDDSFDYNEPDDYVSKKIISQMYEDLKVDSLFMMRMHILSKIRSNTPTTGSVINMNIDRTNTANSVADKLDKLSNETGENMADIILSIREDFDNHLQLHKGEGINIFMEREYEVLFDRLLKMSIEIKSARIVLNFAKNNIPMNLTGKKPDGSDVSQVTQRINKHILDFFSTEASINNKLSSNVNNVFEPIRKTSNKDLYMVLKLFKMGDAVIKREYGMNDDDINKYRNILENVYDRYVQNKKINTDVIKSYLYTGVDEAKSIVSEEKSDTEVRRNVYEVYVGMDLVDADSYDKTKRAPCKLIDKEMEQELLYLVDPRNKTYNVLNKFRDFVFDNDAAKVVDAAKTAVKENVPEEKKIGGTYKNRRRGRITKKRLG